MSRRRGKDDGTQTKLNFVPDTPPNTPPKIHGSAIQDTPPIERTRKQTMKENKVALHDITIAKWKRCALDLIFCSLCWVGLYDCLLRWAGRAIVIFFCAGLGWACHRLLCCAVLL